MKEYIALADRINDIYKLNLKPHNEHRGFVKVFHKLLTKEEANLAMRLGADLETVEEITSRTKISKNTLNESLHCLAQKGVIYESQQDKEITYKLMPFVPGIFEALVGKSHDPDIALYLQEYSEEMKKMTKSPNEVMIPMNCRIDVQTQHVTLKEIELYMNRTDKYALMDCICRTVKKTNGKACGHSIKDMCILIGDYVDYYIRIGNARSTTREEVYEVLLKAEEEGLFHEMYPIEHSDSIFVCNCCVCGCMFLELSNRIKKVLRYQNLVRIKEEKCTQCGICIENCPQQVFSWNKDGTGIEIDEDKCFHCGLCEMLCNNQAIHLN